MEPQNRAGPRLYERWLSPLIYLSSNWLSLAGVVMVTAAAVSWLFLLPTLVRGSTQNPYLGIAGFLILPGVFVFGLVLIPAGIAVRRASLRRQGLEGRPVMTLGSPEMRRLLGFIAATTLANVVIAGQWGYSAVNYMEGVSFCGQACHTVMKPEFTAYQTANHSNVECIKCHAGPGASGFVRAKLAGVNQLVKLALNTYPRPVPTPVHNLRPASETCENCHSPRRRGEDRLRVITKYGDDEKNTPSRTVLMVRVSAIHRAHFGDGVSIRFASDERRLNIPWIERRTPAGAAVFTSPGTKAEISSAPLRTMDCVDCHNRPAHTFESAERAVDRAMADGSISPSLPFAKKQGVEVLKKEYASRDAAAAAIPAAFAQYYHQAYPAVAAGNKAEIERAGERLAAIHGRNVFPEMKVTWGTYPNDLGHTDFDGCFRCHDDQHASSGGTKITQDCGACHNLVAVEEAAPKILGDLGLVESK
jgi:hypothetical protein